MYGALCRVLGPELGDEKTLFASAAWKLIALRAWDVLEEDERSRLEYALHDLNEIAFAPPAAPNLMRAWAAEPEIVALGEWH